MLLEAATFTAPEMLARGFLSRVVPDDRLEAEALGTALRVVALAPQAARLNKQTLRALKCLQRLMVKRLQLSKMKQKALQTRTPTPRAPSTARASPPSSPSVPCFLNLP